MYIRYFESSKNNFSEDKRKIINIMKDISDILNKNYQLYIGVHEIIMPINNIFSAIEKISLKNKTFALNSVGIGDYDSMQAMKEQNSDLVTLFIGDIIFTLKKRVYYPYLK